VERQDGTLGICDRDPRSDRNALRLQSSAESGQRSKLNVSTFLLDLKSESLDLRVVENPITRQDELRKLTAREHLNVAVRFEDHVPSGQRDNRLNPNAEGC
jgi:hypothetical protein